MHNSPVVEAGTQPWACPNRRKTTTSVIRAFAVDRERNRGSPGLAAPLRDGRDSSTVATARGLLKAVACRSTVLGTVGACGQVRGGEADFGAAAALDALRSDEVNTGSAVRSRMA
ncbi:hypothetical protein [Streptomyces sp. NPDC057686]|uniref:hypothetical protein n=1 Tax=Streptomyces sp. NPDC057686 TaxID=3346212 RepID=UPI0036CDC2F5